MKGDFKMKFYRKLLVLFMVFVMLLISVACTKNNTKNKIGKEIELDNIAKITVSTQMTDPIKDVVLEEKEWDEVLKKLNTLSLSKVEEEKVKGWQYLFSFEQKVGDNIFIYFVDKNKIYIGNGVYEVSGYEPNDFLYLFE